MQIRQLASPENANTFVNLDYLGLVQSGLIDVNDFKPVDPEVQAAARRKYRIFKAILISIILTILAIFIGKFPARPLAQLDFSHLSMLGNDFIFFIHFLGVPLYFMREASII